MLFYWWRKKVRKKRIISKPSDFKISPQVPLHPPKPLSLDKIRALTFENKSCSSNYQKFIPFTTSSNTNATFKVQITTKRPSLTLLVLDSIEKIQWTEDHVNSQQLLDSSKEKDLFSRSNRLKRDPFWKAFWPVTT